VDLDELDHRYWDGKFAFDDTNDVLYLSNGRYQPQSSIYKITGAYPDRVEGDVEEIFNIDAHIVGIQFVGPNYIYFSNGREVYRINVNADDVSGSLKLVYSSPGYMDDLAVIGTGELHIPEFIQTRERIWRPDESINKKDKKVDIELAESKQVLSRTTSTASKYVDTQADTQADSEQSSKQMSIAANLRSS
jgi:hypothetical protein